MANWYPHVDVGTPTHSPIHRHTESKRDWGRVGMGLGQGGDGSTQGIFPSQEWLQCLNLLLGT